jgi:hypothetical protein
MLWAFLKSGVVWAKDLDGMRDSHLAFCWDFGRVALMLHLMAFLMGFSMLPTPHLTV